MRPDRRYRGQLRELKDRCSRSLRIARLTRWRGFRFGARFALRRLAGLVNSQPNRRRSRLAALTVATPRRLAIFPWSAWRPSGTTGGTP